MSILIQLCFHLEFATSSSLKIKEINSNIETNDNFLFMPKYSSRMKDIRLCLDKCSLPLFYVKNVLRYRKKKSKFHLWSEN